VINSNLHSYLARFSQNTSVTDGQTDDNHDNGLTFILTA